jgi:hypothetical protein
VLPFVELHVEALQAFVETANDFVFRHAGVALKALDMRACCGRD